MDGTVVEDMVELAGGSFRMGSEQFYPEERPVRLVEVGRFWIDRNPVIAHWDYLGHANVSMADAALARAHRWGALRDQFFLFDR